MSRIRRSDCPIHFGLQVFGDAWSLLIIRDLLFNKRSTYTDFLTSGEKIATNVLADRLVRLVEHGLIVKEVTSPGGGATRYRLSPRGIDLLPLMLDIIYWSAKHDPETAASPAFVKRLRSNRAGLESEIRAAQMAQWNAYRTELEEQLGTDVGRTQRRNPPKGGKRR